ncbi:MAG: hypothetical protein ABI889_15650, partial [Gemmatimonadota bacterium]
SRVLFGMRLETDRLAFRPMVPPSYRGARVLRGVHYRQSTLTITVRGFGDSVRSVRLDGAPVNGAEIMSTTAGTHTIELTMNDRWRSSSVHEVPNRFAPATPAPELRGDSRVWAPIPGTAKYVVSANGNPQPPIIATRMTITPSSVLSEFQVLAINDVGDESFLSEPVRVIAKSAALLVKPDHVALERERAGYSGNGHVSLSVQKDTTIRIPVHIERDGTYTIDVRYANGSGPVNTEDKVAVRTLLVDADTAGVIVMPQRGVNRWTD